MSKPRLSVEERFWGKVEKRDGNECWLWKGNTYDTGYGYFYLNGKHMRAHRYSLMLHKGTLNPKLNVCHNCPTGDNRLCVNPNHLFEGTQKENLQDMVKKGRALTAEKNPSFKLTADVILEMTFLYKQSGLSQLEIANRFGCNQGYFSHLLRGEARPELFEKIKNIITEG